MSQVLVLGLDCLNPDVLDPRGRAPMPALASIADGGTGGTLDSVLPPITVPAWTSMLTGRDPGELGVYGFRNRRSYAYGDLVRATSAAVRAQRIWDRLTAHGRPSVVVGVPQTSPPPALDGVLVSGFEGAGSEGAFTHPGDLTDEVGAVVGEYLFDVPEFRLAAPEDVLATAYEMTRRRFRLMRHLLQTRPWDFAMLHEIGPDRVNHCFWSAHDPDHPRHRPGSRHAGAVAGYYRFLDEQVAALLEAVPADTTVLAASDHGATPMHGGVCVNEILREQGLLVLRDEPREPVPMDASLVDWSRTRAWAEGGYYARVFLNVAGREPQGVVEADAVDALVTTVREVFATLPLGDGRVLANTVRTPAELYRRVRGLPPDLLVFFAGERWRAVGSVGHGSRWVATNDTGADEANHARAGMYALRGPGVARRSGRAAASILDVTPTLIDLLGLPADPSLPGASLLERAQAAHA